MTSPVDPFAIASAVARALDALGIPHTIGGSIASSFAGEPRSTVDIDFVAPVDERHVAPLVAALTSEFYIDDASLLRAIRTHASTNVIHHATQLKVDLFRSWVSRTCSRGRCRIVSGAAVGSRAAWQRDPLPRFQPV